MRQFNLLHRRADDCRRGAPSPFNSTLFNSVLSNARPTNAMPTNATSLAAHLCRLAYNGAP
ncbi:hypothetical protein HMPREF0297_0932 [Corynebacterium jeikeium ATCC 43734]|nr:hypothetical protein HMPREF0297_0932 [Corynebacterium jeikeium ATCC 43734]